MKKCPFCAESIQDEAIKCRFCGSAIPPGDRGAPACLPTARDLVARGKRAEAVDLLTREAGWEPASASAYLDAVTTQPTSTSPQPAPSEPVSRNKRGLGCGAVLLLLVFVYLVATYLGNHEREASYGGRAPMAPSTPGADVASVAPTPAPEQLALLSSRGYESYSYHIVEGEVENIAGEKLERIQAVITWYSANDEMITSDTAIIEYDPLLPGQRSPFKVMSSTNPAMSKYTVAFKRLFGGAVTVDDRRSLAARGES